MMNRILARQLRKYIGDTTSLPEEVTKLLSVISDSYDHFERDRKMLERSIEITSDELTSLNEKLQREAEVLRIKEEHLKASQRIAQVGSWEHNVIDANDDNLYWSDETYIIFGFEPRSVLVTMQLFYSRVHPEDRQKIKDAFQKALDTRGVYEIVHRIILPDGDEKIVYERSEIVYDPITHKAIKALGTVQDITQRYKAEIELEKANNHLRALFENMSETFFSVDMVNYQLIQMSNSGEEIYGRPIQDFKQNPNLWYELILDEDKKIVDYNYPIMLAGEAFSQEYRIRHTDGSIRWVESKIRPTVNAEGRIIRIDGITSDITKRKEYEKALKDSEHKFRSLIEHSSDGVLVADAEGKRVFVSESVQRISGFNPEEMIGKKTFSLVHPDDIETTSRFLQEILKNPGVPMTITYRAMHKNGSYIWCERVSINLLHDPVINGVVSNLRDVTDRKEKEQALEASNEELKKSNAELDKFVYSVSHDLRAPLTSILGLISISKLNPSYEEVVENLNRIEASVKKLDSFIRDILNYSKNARLEIKNEPIHFEQLLEEVVNTHMFMSTKENSVKIKTNIQNGIDFFSDKHRISIILNNLVSNAIKYANYEVPDPYVCISVQLSPDKAVIRVEDNGLGISSEYHDKIFNMFFRASVASVGSGLGLYIVQETLKKLNGTIELQSEPGKGSRFTVHVPNILQTQATISECTGEGKECD